MTKLPSGISSPLHLYERVLAGLGHRVDPEWKILDFGCGEGELVRKCREHGLSVFGCDFSPGRSREVQPLIEEGVLRVIPRDRYRLPFEDRLFDLVISNQVFEHVRNYDSALAEIKRVLKPGGIGLHLFPSRYRPLEGHVFVPLASVVRNRLWLLFWATLGIRTRYQNGLSALATAKRNEEYLRTCTNYLTRAEIAGQVSKYFYEFGFCEKELLRHTTFGQKAIKFFRSMTLLSTLYGTFHRRALFFVNR